MRYPIKRWFNEWYKIAPYNDVGGEPKLTAAFHGGFTKGLEVARGERENNANQLNHDVINRAYGWTIDTHGEVYGLVEGDMGYEPTGIKIDDATLEIWKLGYEAWYEKNEQK